MMRPDSAAHRSDANSDKALIFNGDAGVAYYGYRYYAPEGGRWQSRDPIGERGGLNLYSFVANKTIDVADLLGLATVNDCEIYILLAHGSKTTPEPWTLAPRSAAGAATCFPATNNGGIAAGQLLANTPNGHDDTMFNEGTGHDADIATTNTTSGIDPTDPVSRENHPEWEHSMERAYLNMLKGVSAQRDRLCALGCKCVKVIIDNRSTMFNSAMLDQGKTNFTLPCH